MEEENMTLFRSKHYKSKRKSPRKKEIEKVLTLIRKINNIKYHNCCFFCGRIDGIPHSNCHVFSVGSAPGMELTIENIVPACWSSDFRYKKCHNLWEKRDEKYRPIFEQKLRDTFGADYFEKLYLMK